MAFSWNDKINEKGLSLSAYNTILFSSTIIARNVLSISYVARAYLVSNLVCVIGVPWNRNNYKMEPGTYRNWCNIIKLKLL